MEVNPPEFPILLKRVQCTRVGWERGECFAAGGRLRPLSRLIPSNRLAAPYRVVSPSIGSSKLLSETIWRLFAACQLFLVSYFTIM